MDISYFHTICISSLCVYLFELFFLKSMLSLLCLEKTKRKKWGREILDYKMACLTGEKWGYSGLICLLSHIPGGIIALVFLLFIFFFFFSYTPFDKFDLFLWGLCWTETWPWCHVFLFFSDAKTKKLFNNIGRIPVSLIPGDLTHLIRPVISTISSGRNWTPRLQWDPCFPPCLSNFFSIYPSLNQLFPVNPCCRFCIWLWAPLPSCKLAHVEKALSKVLLFFTINKCYLLIKKKVGDWIKSLINILDQDQLTNIAIIYQLAIIDTKLQSF